MDQIFFSGSQSLLRTAQVGILAYVVLVFFLRVSGNRTLSKLSAFDLVVTIALGSTLATVLLNKDIALADGALAFALLIGLQYAVTWTSVRVEWLRRLFTGEPRMLFHEGVPIEAALRRERITEGEIWMAIRASGIADAREVKAVVLETDGSLSVVQNSGAATVSSLCNVRAPHPPDSAA